MVSRKKETENVEAQVSQEAGEEAKALPSFTVTFSGAGIEVVCREMNAVPLALIERAQHVAFRKIMQDRQAAARAVPQAREAGWDNSQERNVKDAA